jgi:hypothetical protein
MVISSKYFSKGTITLMKNFNSVFSKLLFKLGVAGGWGSRIYVAWAT